MKNHNRCAVCGSMLSNETGSYASVMRRYPSDNGTRKTHAMFTARLCSICGQKFAERCVGLLEGMK